MFLNHMPVIPAHQWPAAGTVISVPIGFGLRHKGIVSDRWFNGKPMVISGSNRRGCVCEETLEDFAGNQEWRVDELIGPINGIRAAQRARAKLGTKYSIGWWNCDHLVHYAVGLNPVSPQIVMAAVSIAALLALAAKNGMIKLK